MKPQRYDALLRHAGVTPNDAAIAGALLPLDNVAMEVEGRWGIDVLPRLVSPATAGKFESARKKLDDAIASGDAAEVARRAGVMIRGWRALEAEAHTLARPGLEPGEFWSVRSDDDVPYLFVMHEVETGPAAKAYPDHRVWSMREVVRILASHELTAVQQAKDIFPGATVAAVKTTTDWNAPLDDLAPPWED